MSLITVYRSIYLYINKHYLRDREKDIYAAHFFARMPPAEVPRNSIVRRDSTINTHVRESTLKLVALAFASIHSLRTTRSRCTSCSTRFALRVSGLGLCLRAKHELGRCSWTSFCVRHARFGRTQREGGRAFVCLHPDIGIPT